MPLEANPLGDFPTNPGAYKEDIDNALEDQLSISERILRGDF